IIRWVKYWDNQSKLQLINRISNDMLNEDVKKEDVLLSTFGGWETDASAEEIISDIRESRYFVERKSLL
ncbi:MAG: hypothetical protein AAFP82_18470, partial [Bacteroidota bacterium]